ncbi:MAG: D-2-hydroxyacid dehydrogenase family protein [Betaproteobacteria bacterium]|nr:D-2-hydroxyacid dehydrogenase family protein [Betaproteobacteria bacterium]
MKIAVIDDYQDAFRGLDCYVRLKGHEVIVYHDTVKDPLRLAERIKDAEVLLLTQQRTPFPRALAEKLPKLKVISQTGRNANHIDIAACTEKGILVSAGGVGNPAPTAELTWGLILSALRSIPQEVQRMKQGKWQGSVGTGVGGKALGVYAYGKIGSIVARVGKAFGMRVVCWGREGSTGRARADGYEVAASREAFFAEADVLCLHLPLNAETRGIVKRADLALMKPTALIVNTSRAPIIEAGALVEALKQGRPGRAAVDVYEEEPVLDGNHPLLKMDNALCTPHLGYVEKGTYESYFGAAIEQILAFAAGKPVAVLNPEVLKKQ